MAKIEYNYFIYEGEEVVFGSTAQVNLTKKDLKETESFIKEHGFSAEFVDIPGKVFDKCMQKAFEKAYSEYPDLADRYEDLTVELEQFIPEELILQLSDDLKREMLSKDPYNRFETDTFSDSVTNQEESNVREPQPEMTETESETVITDEKASEDPAAMVKEDVNQEEEQQQSITPTKENTLYLVIKQVYFDQIIEGTKKEEYRVIKPTTYSKYLECDEDGYPYFYESLVDINNPLCGDINIWNQGVYPFIPKDNHEFLHLAVGYNKERDEAIVEIEDITFEPVLDKSGMPCRFNDDNGNGVRCSDGDLCLWNIVYHLGDVVEVHRRSSK